MQTGLVLELAVKKFAFPLYIFNPLNKDRSFVVGANFELNFKKKKTAEPTKEDFIKESFPVRILANNKEDQNFITEKGPGVAIAKPAAESIIKIRRVNVVLRTKPDENNEVKAPVSITPKNNTIANPIPVPLLKKAGASDTLKSNTAPIKKASQTNLTEPDANSPAAEQIQASSSHTANYYALVLGPFKSEEEAKLMRLSLTSTFSKEVTLFADNGLYKLRIAGFTDEDDAKKFKQNVVSEGLKAASSVVSYQLKSMNTLHLKNAAELFKATKL
jgi:cell division protein FtsN